MALTIQQLQQNIDALEQQWAPKEDIQWYIDTLQVNAQWQYEPKGTPPAKPKSMADILTWIGAKQQEFTQGAVTGAIRWIGNIGSFATRNAGKGIDWLVPWTPMRDIMTPIGEKFKAWAEKIASSIEWVNTDLDPLSKTSKVGQFAWQVALTAPIGGIAGKAVTTTGKIGLGALEGALQWGALDIASRDKLGAWVIAWWVIWAGAPLLSKAGKALYKKAIKPNADEASQIIKATAKKTTQPITRADTAFKYGIIWRENDIWVQWVREANKIFTKNIEPAFAKAEKQWIKFDYATLVKKAKDNISKSNLYSATQKKEILENIREIGKSYKWTTGLKNLDLEKQAIVSKIPKKYIWVLKVPKELTAAQNELSSVFRNTVHDTLKKKFGINSAQMYKDYGNLVELEKIGIKWITEWGLRWGTGTALSTIYDALVTPIKTIGGKTLYKVWEWLQFTWPKGITSIKDLAKKAGYKLVGDLLQKE